MDTIPVLNFGEPSFNLRRFVPCPEKMEPIMFQA